MIFPFLLLALFALVIFGGFVGMLVAAIWVGGGIYMVTNTGSRGIYADTVFVLTWPIHLALER